VPHHLGDGRSGAGVTSRPGPPPEDGQGKRKVVCYVGGSAKRSLRSLALADCLCPGPPPRPAGLDTATRLRDVAFALFLFFNDVRLRDEAVSRAEVYRQAGYRTAYIGKWHLYGNQRIAFIPREAQQYVRDQKGPKKWGYEVNESGTGGYTN